jgi:outer membrane protein OmpA-like peptidoglycan-associated protein
MYIYKNETRRIALVGLFFVIAVTAFSQRTVSIKNNLLYDATLTPNIGIEAAVGNRSSLQLFYGLNPWNGYHGMKKLQHWSLMPEYRYWLSGEQFRGWFTGIHGVGGEYNVAGVKLPFGLFKPLHYNHYEGWFVGGGLTLGHAWKLSEHWNLEAAIGVGYIHTKFSRYENEECGELLERGHYNYVGPTKLALNIAYVFGKKAEPVLPPPPPTVKELYKPQYQLAYVTPQAEQEKSRQLSGKAFLDFVVNKTDIRPEYRGNAAELAKVLRTIDVVRQDSFTTITHISIHGYASPESPYQHNAYLAQARAEAFCHYVQSLIQLPAHIFSVASTPEDWQGLLTALDKMGTMDNIDAIRAIVTSNDEPDQKERQLKKQYPQQWRYLLDNIFPALRHSDYEVSYTVRPFTVDEAKRLIREKPQHLSLNEMFLVANTYEPGSQDFNDTFETAVRMYPDNETANLNAAVSALQRDDLITAARYLEKAGQSAEAFNARGILAVKQNRQEEAEQLFLQSSCKAAQYNLNELRQYLESMQPDR